MENMMTLADMMAQSNELKPLMSVIEQIMALSDDNLTTESVEMMSGMITGGFTPQIKEKGIAGLVEDFETQGMPKAAVVNAVNDLKQTIVDLTDELKPSALKKQLLDSMFSCFYEIFDGVIERYHNFNITLPFKLDEGARVPTYAHESDACADVYAIEDVTIKAHSVSTMINTGLHIGLPEGWQARLVARSSTGAKTPLRLSNAVPVIDTDYRGPIKLVFDNNSDFDYQIKAGDRIAQMWVEPVYRFKAVVVDELSETERNDKGIGSTGR